MIPESILDSIMDIAPVLWLGIADFIFSSFMENARLLCFVEPYSNIHFGFDSSLLQLLVKIDYEEMKFRS